MADSSRSGPAAAKLNYTPDERALFGRLFRECDPEGSTVVTGEAAVRMFQRSRLSEQVLSEIWAMADTENRGFLVQEDFAKAMRLIGQYQANPGITLRPDLALSPAPLPKFDGVNLPASSQPPFPPQGIPAQNSGPIRVPPLTTDRIAEYMRLFDRAGAQNGLLSGELARASFELSGQPSEILAAIWNLVDTEQRGSLILTEFIIAMHLLASYKAKTLTALPPAIPAGLYEAASRRPAQAGSSVRSPTIRPGELSQIPRQTSGPSAARGPQGRPVAPAATTDWAIGPREKTSYDELFDKVDTQRQGFISGEQAVLFFSDSGLPSEVLAAIWDLANFRRLDQLNRDEFAVAMYLIRNQRGKSQPDLPSELPPNLIPPSLRSIIQPQASGISFGQLNPPPPPPQAAPSKSNADDLFGLDALTSSSSSAPVKEQTTGGSGPFNRSAELDPFGAAPASPSSSQQFSARGTSNTFFKSFAPTSSFGQSIASQNTGASTGSAPSVSKAPAMDDLLGDADPEVSKKLTKETADLANMSNQIGMLRTQMQAVQTKKGAAESQLATNSSQKRDMEARLQQFRSQYEQEVKSLKQLEDQLASERNDITRLNQQIAMAQATYQDVQNRHREVSTNLENTKRENTGLKDRLRQMNEYISQAKPEIEKLQSEHRQQRGLVAIQKKQVEKLEEERVQLEKMKTELVEPQREQDRPAVSREVTAASAVSGSSSTNPFMRRSPQSSMDNTMSPSGFSRTLSGEPNKFNDIFHSAYSTPAATNVPPTSFRDAFGPQDSSVKSSERGMPFPSTSSPISSYQEPSHVPIPPASRQLTSNDLPFGDNHNGPESKATSVRVESPMSRYDFSTPTNTTSSPHTSIAHGTDNTKAGSTGTAMFERSIPTSSPVASVKSEASKQASKDSGHFFGSPSSGFEASTPGTGSLPDRSKDTGRSEAVNAPRQDPFSFNPGKSATTGKGEFDAAFASVGRSDSGVNGTSSDPVAKFNNEFPPIQDEFPGAKAKGKDEFPPIKERELEEEESDSDTGGFDDDFTKASPKPKSSGKETDRGFGSSQGFDPPFQNFPPIAPEPPLSSGGDFGPPVPSSGTKEAEKPFSAPSSGSQGEALFGGPKGPPNNSSSMFSISPPETNRTSNRSDTYQSAVSHQSSTDNAFPSTVPQSSQGQAAISPKPARPSAFDFDSGFDDLDDAKEEDNHDDDDLMGFGPPHPPEHDFNPMFDAPASGKDRTPTGPGKHSFPEDHFDDFESNFSGPKSSSTHGPSSKVASTSSPHDWDALMKGIDVDPTAHAHPASIPPPPPPMSSLSPTIGKSPAGKSAVSTKDFDSLSPAFPEAPEPPRLGPAVSAGTEHDDPILKRLTSMGYPRPLALAALEKYDYDLDKATDFLASPK